jgi:3-isopropylmalate dehydrogenase
MPIERDLVVFPGDGIGPEIVEESLRVLAVVSSTAGIKFRLHYCNIGDAVKDRTGVAVPQEALELFGQHKLALKGPVGESVGDFVSRVRIGFDLYANVRPVKSYPRISPPALRGDIDLVVVRENLEDVYIAKENQINPGVWKLEGIFSQKECERIAKYSFELARSRRKKLAIGHKANILRRTHGLFAGVFEEVSKAYADVAFESYYADALSALLVRRPHDFDVIACPNLIGDILSDLAAEVGGGLGLAGSANINPETGMGLFEPTHGSAPDIAGKKIADPISEIRCASLMLKFLSTSQGDLYSSAAATIDEAISRYLGNSALDALPIHLGGKAGTVRVTDVIISEIVRIQEKEDHPHH